MNPIFGEQKNILNKFAHPLPPPPLSGFCTLHLHEFDSRVARARPCPLQRNEMTHLSRMSHEFVIKTHQKNPDALRHDFVTSTLRNPRI